MKIVNLTDTLQNMVAKRTRSYTHLKPKVLTLVTTNRCNSRCAMCNIWRKKQMAELKLRTWKRVIGESGSLKHVGVVNITGGEPFLRNDLVDIVRFLVKNLPKLEEIRFATNGLLAKKIIEDMNKIVELPCNFNIKVSIDGRETTHDTIRGVDGAYFMAESTIASLLAISKKRPNLDVAVAHTIMPQNFNEAREVYDRHMGLDFIFKVAYHAKAFNNEEFDIGFTDKQKQAIIANLRGIYREEANKLRDTPRNFKRFKKISYLLYMRHHIALLENPGAHLPCHATFSSITIESDGKVYSCGIIQKELGDLRKEGFDSIWAKNKDIRDFINAGRCRCSNACDTLPSLMMENIPEVVKKFLA